MQGIQVGFYYHLPDQCESGYLARETQTGAVVLVKPGNPDDTLLVVNGQIFDRKMLHVCDASELFLVRV